MEKQSDEKSLVKQNGFFAKLKDRFSKMFVKKEPKEELLYEEEISRYPELQRVRMPLSRVTKDTYYHTIEENGKLKYISTPISKMELTDEDFEDCGFTIMDGLDGLAFEIDEAQYDRISASVPYTQKQLQEYFKSKYAGMSDKQIGRSMFGKNHMLFAIREAEESKDVFRLINVDDMAKKMKSKKALTPQQSMSFLPEDKSLASVSAEKIRQELLDHEVTDVTPHKAVENRSMSHDTNKGRREEDIERD